MSKCPHTGKPCSKSSPCQTLASLAECEEFAKIQPEEFYQEVPTIPTFNLEDVVQGLVSLYALGYGGKGIDDSPLTIGLSEGSANHQFPSCPEDIRFWTQVDALCQIGERIQNGEEVKMADLPRLSRADARRMFHLTMEAQVGLLPKGSLECSGVLN